MKKQACYFVNEAIISIQIIMCLCLIPSISEGTSIAKPHPYVVASEDGRFYFKMMPARAPEDVWNTEAGEGICYEVQSGETDKILWRTSGWYSYEVFISRDGRYLARLGGLCSECKSPDNYLAISFYKDGRFIRRYSTNQLVRDSLAAKGALGFNRWPIESVKFDSSSNEIYLTTIDNVYYVFDISTGGIKKVKDPKKE